MQASDPLDFWPRSRTFKIPDQDLREYCGVLIGDCRSLVERHGGALFTQPPGEIAAVLDATADLRATAMHWDGYFAVEMASGRSAPNIQDLRLLTAAAADAVDDLMLSIEREWLDLEVGAAERLLVEPALDAYRNYLTGVRSLAVFGLGDEAEEALAAREATANTAWVDLYYRITTMLRPIVNGSTISLERARSELERADGVRREHSLNAIYDVVEPMASVLSLCLDSLVADQLAIDEVRGLPHPRAARDLTNELPSDVVDDMLAVVEEHYELAQRWFARKARMLGMDRLGYAHMRAPIGSTPRIPYPDAVRTVTEAFDGFATEAGDLVRAMVAGGYVDAEPRDGKQPGAFCRSLGPGRPPRILMSYFGTVEDVVGLGHEFGHALQFDRAGRRQNGLTFDAPLSLNEVAPAFTELLVVDRLIDNERDPDIRRLLAAKRVDATVDAIFMSTFLTRFETRAHRARAEGGALTDTRIRALWIECGRQFYGPAVDLPARWGLHWILVPHVTHERFYSYTYALARLIGLRLYADYQRDPDSFRPKFLDMLSRGSSIGPSEQLSLLDIDLSDRSTWSGGIDQFSALLAPLLDR